MPENQVKHYRIVSPDELAAGDQIILTQSYGEGLEIQIKGTVEATMKDPVWYVQFVADAGRPHGWWTAKSSDEITVTVSRLIKVPTQDGVVILVDKEPFIYRKRREEQGTNPWEGLQVFLSTADVINRGFAIIHTPEV